MSSIRVERLAFAYSDRVPLLRDVDLHLGRGFTGIVGENGSGKSTLVRLVAGELVPRAGRVVLEPGTLVAVCPQDLDEVPDDAVALAARSDASAGRWRAILALDDEQLSRWSSLSPGERRRWQLGGALAREPDVLLLDEPTNHIDATCRAHLVDALARFDGIALVISHDRVLLDELTVATVRIRGGTAHLYPGGYSDARRLWEADDQRALEVRADARRAAATAQRHLVATRDDHRANAAPRRKKGIRDHDTTSMGRKVVAGWAEDRLGRRVEVARRAAERAIEAIPDGAVDRALGRSIFVDYERCPRRFVLELDTPAIAAGDHVVVRDVRVAVRASDRIRIAGSNGAGKTTLLGALLASHTLPADRVLSLPQELDADAVASLVAETRSLPPACRGRVLSLVAALGVEPDRLLASAAPSPGEARKLALAMGLGRHAWVVVLDEPTNHLDLPSIERLEEALAAYPGAIVLVSHDDRFAARCTDQIWQVRDGQVTCARSE